MNRPIKKNGNSNDNYLFACQFTKVMQYHYCNKYNILTKVIFYNGGDDYFKCYHTRKEQNIFDKHTHIGNSRGNH